MGTRDTSKLDNPSVVFSGPGEVCFEEAPIGKPSPGEVLLRTRRTLISTGTELTVFTGNYTSETAWGRHGRFPYRAGYSAAGEVAEVGPGVSAFAVGDIVAASTRHARYVIAPEESLTLARDGANVLDWLAFTTLNQTVLNGVRRSGASLGDAVVVFGLGLLGQLAVRYAHLSGARPVVGVDVAALRLGAIPERPGIAVVDASRSDVVSAVSELTCGRMADIVFEVTGDPALIPEEFDVLKPSEGRFVVLSSPRGPPVSISTTCATHPVIRSSVRTRTPIPRSKRRPTPGLGRATENCS